MPIKNAEYKGTNTVSKFLNHKGMLEELFCDFAKTFQCTNHEIFLSQSHFYGLQGPGANWL